ncbi:MAG TPA: hypothetical protein VMS78_03420 [Rhizomicrobium sp.]|nr:hypothetical protein [Rhizomicrobium sp.]
MAKPELTVETLIAEAKGFSVAESKHDEPTLFGVTDGKAVGTYLEQKFRTYIFEMYEFPMGNSASGIDFPGIGVDIKVTSIKQPQSSSPFKDARQKIYGLGYHLLVFVYEKTDDEKARTGKLNIQHTIFIEKGRTADYQMTTGILKILKNSGNVEDLIGFFDDKNLPGDDVTRTALANEVMKTPPVEGYLTISNALQWRLQYGRAIQKAGTVDGIIRIT